MKRSGWLRILCIISFLLLIAPFYDQCGDSRFRKNIEATETTFDSTATETSGSDSAEVFTKTLPPPVYVDPDIPFYEKVYDYINPDNSENAFELAQIAGDYCKDDYFAECKAEFLEEQKKGPDGRPYTVIFFPLKFFAFVFIIAITIVVMILSFTKKTRWIYKLTISNIVFLAFALVCIFFFDPLFEEFSQIKWGFYAFIISQVMTLMLSKRQRHL